MMSHSMDFDVIRRLVEGAFPEGEPLRRISLSDCENNPEAVGDRELYGHYTWRSLPAYTIRRYSEGPYYFDSDAQFYYYPRFLLSMVDPDSDMDVYTGMRLTEDPLLAEGYWNRLSQPQQDVVLKVLDVAITSDDLEDEQRDRLVTMRVALQEVRGR